MQTARHIYSGVQGKIIGAHHGLQAQLIKLPTGEEQYWKNDCLIKGEEMELDQIKFTLSSSKAKSWQTIERYFNTEPEALQYLSELRSLNDIRVFSEDGRSASISNGWSITSNRNLRKLLKNAPKNATIDLTKSLSRKAAINRQSPADLPNKPRPAKQWGRTVKLQDLTKDSRKARVILRDLVRKNKITKPGRWEWDANSPDLEVVRKALSTS